MALSDWIDQHAGITPDKPALIFNNSSISYQSLANQINDFTQILGTEHL